MKAILIVDDSPADRAALRIAFQQTGLPLVLHFAPGSSEALEMLKPDQEVDHQLVPHLMMVDVKMPGTSGIELLKLLKSNDDLMTIPVFMFSGSDDQQDIDDAYRAYASGYIRKPSDLGDLNVIANTLGKMCCNVLAFTVPH